MQNPERIAAPMESAGESVDEMVVTEISRHGPSSAADLLANVGAPPYAVIDAATRLFIARVIRLVVVDGEKRFTLRRRDS